MLCGAVPSKFASYGRFLLIHGDEMNSDGNRLPPHRATIPSGLGIAISALKGLIRCDINELQLNSGKMIAEINTFINSKGNINREI